MNNNNFDYTAVPDRFTSQGNMPDRLISLAGGAIPDRYQTSANILNSVGATLGTSPGQNVERVTTQAMLGQEKAVYKEIAKGVVLQKVQVPLVGAGDGAEVKYVFKVRICCFHQDRYNRRQSRRLTLWQISQVRKTSR